MGTRPAEGGLDRWSDAGDKAGVAEAPAPRPGRTVEQMLADLESAPPRRATSDSVRVVLFDLDNTLVDFMRVKRLASDACARAMVAAGADFGSTVDKVSEMLFHHYLASGIESDDAFQSFLRQYQRNRLSYTQHQMDRVLAAGINAYLRTKDLLLAPYPGARELLVGLTRRGYRMGVVTDAPRLKAWQRLHAVGLAEFFEVVVTRTDAGEEKPNGRGFLLALEALEAQPFEAAMVGDWAERDVVGGNRLGLFTVLARYGHPSKADLPPAPEVPGVAPHETEPDAIADHPTDLLDWLHGTR